MGATVAELAGELLDPARQSARAAEISRLMAELVRLGGVCPPNPRYPHSDGRLRAEPARRIATAVVAGSLDWTDDVLRLLDAGTAKSLADPERTPAAWVYLVGTVPKILSDPDRPKRKPR
jgi:hypothetical protein